MSRESPPFRDTVPTKLSKPPCQESEISGIRYDSGPSFPGKRLPITTAIPVHVFSALGHRPLIALGDARHFAFHGKTERKNPPPVLGLGLGSIRPSPLGPFLFGTGLAGFVLLAGAVIEFAFADDAVIPV